MEESKTEAESFEFINKNEIEKTDSSTDNGDSEKEEWMDILGSGQLKKKILKAGQDESRPLRGNICHIRYTMCLEDGTLVETEDDLEVQLGDAEVIQGLELALPLMNVGEEAQVEVHARFGYGKLGRAPDVPASANLLYTIQLLSAEAEPEIEDLTVSQRRQIGMKKRERGNWWYSREEHSMAIQCYRKALEYLDEAEGGISYDANKSKDDDQELRQLLDDRLKVYNNLAAAQMKIKAFDTALQSVENVLRCQPENVKALFRKGKILCEKGENEQALEALQAASSLEPDNKVISQEVARAVARSKQDRREEKSLYRRMLGQDKPADEPTSEDQKKSKVRLSWGLIAGSVVALSAGLVLYRFKSFY